MTDDLSSLKDDMTAFIEGHGLRRFHGLIPDDMRSVLWDAGDNADSWKDFVELAKASGAPFVTMSSVTLERSELDYLIRRLDRASYISEDDLEDARWLRSFLGKTGFVQLGFPFQGVLFIHEDSCEWYERYQRLNDMVDDFSVSLDDPEEDDR
jgi:hypothetical protein